MKQCLVSGTETPWWQHMDADRSNRNNALVLGCFILFKWKADIFKIDKIGMDSSWLLKKMGCSTSRLRGSLMCFWWDFGHWDISQLQPCALVWRWERSKGSGIGLEWSFCDLLRHCQSLFVNSVQIAFEFVDQFQPIFRVIWEAKFLINFFHASQWLVTGEKPS